MQYNCLFQTKKGMWQIRTSWEKKRFCRVLQVWLRRKGYNNQQKNKKFWQPLQQKYKCVQIYIMLDNASINVLSWVIRLEQTCGAIHTMTFSHTVTALVNVDLLILWIPVLDSPNPQVYKFSLFFLFARQRNVQSFFSCSIPSYN